MPIQHASYCLVAYCGLATSCKLLHGMMTSIAQYNTSSKELQPLCIYMGPRLHDFQPAYFV